MAISAEEVKKRAYDLKDQITQDRRYLHQIPEIGTILKNVWTRWGFRGKTAGACSRKK